MIWRKYSNFCKHVLKRFTFLIIFYYIINNQIILSYIYKVIKSSWYDVTVPLSDDNGCALSNPFHKPETFLNQRCISCESVNEIYRLHDTMYEEIELNYIKRNYPVIITDAMYSWEIDKKTINVVNLTEVYLRPTWMYNYIACDLLSNFDLKTNYLMDFLAVISNPGLDNWFIRWKNCDLKAVKIARHFYEQPYFTKYYLPAARINWIVVSHRYSTNRYYEIPTKRQKLILLKQLKGSFKIRLLPRSECQNLCQEINEMMNESEILTLNTNLWRIFYSPRSTDTSIAIITENEL